MLFTVPSTLGPGPLSIPSHLGGPVLGSGYGKSSKEKEDTCR